VRDLVRARRHRGRSLAFTLMLTLATGVSCSHDVAERLSGPRRVVTDYDPIYAAIQMLAGNCAWVADELMNHYYGTNKLIYADVQGLYGDIAYTLSDGTILIDQSHYNSPDMLEYLAADIMHEAGHSIGDYPDDPEVPGELHHNPYDDGCPVN